MKESVLSNSEKSFILNAVSEGRRLDGRALDEFRDLNIHFGSDWGCCFVTLGQTKVVAQVSCDVQQPKSTRPNEGLLLIFVELSPMAAPHFESGRPLDLAVHLNRLLEKCFKDSRCVDLESLCIVAEEKVWAVRVDINILNHDGSLIDAASVAALAALSHFRRPDVTMTGEQITIHNPGERDSLPIAIHHHPVCISFAIFGKQTHVLADPIAIEERVSDGSLIFGVNSNHELCTLHLGGNAPVSTHLLLQYAARAAGRASVVVSRMAMALKQDLESRASGNDVGFRQYVEGNNLLSLRKDTFCIQLNSEGLHIEKNTNETKGPVVEYENTSGKLFSKDKNDEESVVVLGKGSAELVSRRNKTTKERRRLRYREERGSDDESELSSSELSSSDLISDSSNVSKGSEEMEQSLTDSDVEVVAVFQETGTKVIENKVIGRIQLRGDSEDEMVMNRNGDQTNCSSEEYDIKEVKKETNENNVIARIQLRGDNEEYEMVKHLDEDNAKCSTDEQEMKEPTKEKKEVTNERRSRGWYSNPVW